jgi:hypothetical protein
MDVDCGRNGAMLRALFATALATPAAPAPPGPRIGAHLRTPLERHATAGAGRTDCHGVAGPLAGGEPIRAAAYVASPGRRLSSEQAPSPAWLDAVIRGARAAGLSPEWTAELLRLRERR